MNKKIDGRSKAVKTLSKNGILFLSEKVRDYKLSEWITSYIKDQEGPFRGELGVRGVPGGEGRGE